MKAKDIMTTQVATATPDMSVGQIAELMQSYLAPVGIEATPTVLEWAALLGAIMDPTKRDFDGVVMGWLPDFTLDESDFFHSGRSEGSLAWGSGIGGFAGSPPAGRSAFKACPRETSEAHAAARARLSAYDRRRRNGA